MGPNFISLESVKNNVACVGKKHINLDKKKPTWVLLKTAKINETHEAQFGLLAQAFGGLK